MASTMMSSAVKGKYGVDRASVGLALTIEESGGFDRRMLSDVDATGYCGVVVNAGSPLEIFHFQIRLQ